MREGRHGRAAQDKGTTGQGTVARTTTERRMQGIRVAHTQDTAKGKRKKKKRAAIMHARQDHAPGSFTIWCIIIVIVIVFLMF